MLRSRRRYFSRRMPDPRNLSPQCLNRRASKLILRCPLRCPLSRSPNHNSTNSTNKSNLFCQRLNKGTGPSLPIESYRAPTENVTTNCFPEP